MVPLCTSWNVQEVVPAGDAMVVLLIAKPEPNVATVQEKSACDKSFFS